MDYGLGMGRAMLSVWNGALSAMPQDAAPCLLTPGSNDVKASMDWVATSGAAFSAGLGQSGFAHLKHYTVEYREWGEGPPLILVPGLAGGFELLGPLARILAQRFRVISYQLRGEDDCFALRQRFDLSDLVQDLAEFLDWQCLERPTVMGVSFGGALALEFSVRHPNRLNALVVQGAGARFERGLVQQIAGIVLARYPLPPDNPFVNQFFNLLFGGRQKKGPLFNFVTRQIWQTDQSVMAHRFQMVERFDMDNRLERIQSPVLVLSGDRDMLVSPKNLQALADRIAHARVASLSRCGHLAFVTQPEKVANEVVAFLETVNPNTNRSRPTAI
jgi:pimeloyl-ACP methyl ester carboxylesterase